MAQTQSLLRYARSLAERYAVSRIPAMVSWGIVVLVVSATQSAAAHGPAVPASAIGEASRVACQGALGRGIFLVFGLTALALFLGGILQIALGFMKMGGRGGGGMQRQASGREGLKNGGMTLSGGLVLGSIGGVLNYLGVDVSACLDTGNIISVAPHPDYLTVALELAVITG